MPPVLGTPDGKHGAKHAGQTHPWHHRKNPLNSKETLSPSEKIYTARLAITGTHQLYLPTEIQKMLEGAGRIRLQLI